MQAEKRVLLSAYACEPGTGSEGGVGWNWMRQVALRNECVLVTRENNVQAILDEAKKQGLDKLEVVGYDLPYWMRFWKRKSRGAMVYFYLWQIGLVFVARRLNRLHNFDLVHHLTFVASWTPSGLALVGKPFVWGPVGQHPRIPKRFLVDAPLALRVSESVKVAIKWGAVHLDPFLRLTMSRATKILSLGSEFEKRSNVLARSNVQRIPAVGVDAITPGEKSGHSVLFSGRLVPLKGPEIALEAFAKAHKSHPKLHLTYLGEGPMAAELKRQAAELGVADAVTFAGRRPLEEALEMMASADYFLFPSFEGAGMVIPEAMASRAIVVCLDFGGPGDMVARERGVAVALGETKTQTADNLAKGFEALLESPTRQQEIRDLAETWIREEMLWDRKGDKLQAIYEDVMLQASAKG